MGKRGRPRKVNKGSIANEDNTSNQTAAPTSNLDSTNAETTVNLENIDSPTKNKTSQATSASPRQSDCLKRKSEPLLPLNPAERKKKESKGRQVSSSQRSTERNSEQEAPHGHQLHIGQDVDEGNLVEKGSSSGNVDPSADFKSLYMASKRKVEKLTEENVELKKQLNMAQGKIDGYENVLLQRSVESTEKDIPDATDGHKASSSKKKGTGSKKKGKA